MLHEIFHSYHQLNMDKQTLLHITKVFHSRKSVEVMNCKDRHKKEQINIAKVILKKKLKVM